MKALQVILGACSSLPAGNRLFDFEEAYKKFYKPFLTQLNRFSAIPAVLYLNGPLLEWLEENHPEYPMLLKEMVKAKQVELLGGGFYDPILTLIPDPDKFGQIEKLTTYLRSAFDARPRGSWIVEKVWEPGLVKVLKSSGLEYTFLDREFFQIAGLTNAELPYPRLTEDQGKTIAVFPLFNHLLDQSLWEEPKRILKALRGLADESGERVVALVFEEAAMRSLPEKGLAAFLETLDKAREWIQPVTPRQYLRQSNPRGRIYFSCLAGKDMMIWSLRQDLQASYKIASAKFRSNSENGLFLRGGFFRQFLSKYPEVNLLYSRMIHTHLLVGQIRGDKYRKMSARNDLWKGQLGGTYWHGREAGIYDNRLRHWAYQAFLEAEQRVRRTDMVVPSILRTDFDMDGEEEFLYHGGKINVFIHKLGASAFEMDYLPAAHNYLNTMSRWKEPYHSTDAYGCDRYPRKSFLDHFFGRKASPESFDRMNYTELGDFLNRPFEVLELNRDTFKLILQRKGSLDVEGIKHPLLLRKHYQLRDAGLDLACTVENQSQIALDLWYGLEVNLSLTSRDAESSRLYGNSKGEETELSADRCTARELSAYIVKDLANGVRITLSSASPFSLWSLPVETMSAGSQGLQKRYQSTCAVPQWRFSIKPAESWEVKITLRFEREREKDQT